MGVELCPVQLKHYESKCQPHSDFDEEKMLGEPHMRGVKRKFNATDSETLPTVPQRQTIFNITMFKLSRFRQTPEPSLLRSVLIFNTLRYMEREDGFRLDTQNDFNSNHTPMDVDNNNHHEITSNNTYHYTHNSLLTEVNANPDEICHNYGNILDPNEEQSKCRSLLELDHLSSGRITPFTRSVYDRVDAGALWNDDTDSLTSLNWSSVLNFNSQTQSNNNNNNNVDKNVPENLTETSLHTLMPPSQGSPTLTTLSNPNSNSSTNPLLNNGNVIGSITNHNRTEEIFGDIDLSLYDFDVLSPLSPPNVKLAPLTAEELMRSLAGSTDNNNAVKTADEKNLVLDNNFTLNKT